MTLDRHIMGPELWQPPLVALMGLGMVRDDLSLRALRWIERAEVLAGGKRHLDLFPEHPGERIMLKAPLERALDELRSVSRQKRTAVLASGDPFFFGIGRRLVQLLGKDHLVTLPNVTTVQALFARLAEPWEDVKVVSLHGRAGAARASWLHELRSASRLALYTDAECTPDAIARQLKEAGITDRDLVVAEDLGLPTERIRRLSPEEAAEMSFSPLNLVAVFQKEGPGRENGPPAPRTVMGLPEGAFEHEAGLITKMEVRAVALAHLQLEPGLVLWDLGAGSGSVVIEAARMVGLGYAAAVEKHPRRYEDLSINIRKMGCPEIQPFQGSAADVVDLLPDPDRVFIGGSGEDLPQILDLIARRLRPGGRVVQTAVTLDTLDAVRSFWRGRPFEMSVIQLQVNRSVPIGKTVRFEPMNPVFIVTVRRVEEGCRDS